MAPTTGLARGAGVAWSRSGFGADGKRVRKKVSGQIKAGVRDKLQELHTELDAGGRADRGRACGPWPGYGR
jgi:hypothetical protein